MINNLDKIKEFIEDESEDVFYFLQIIKRKKENPELGSNNHIIKTYYVTSIHLLEKIMPEVINLCEFHNARAYINLNKRSFEKCAFQMLKKVTDIILNKDYKSVKNAYNSVCGEASNSGKDKTWILDFDLQDKDNTIFIEDLSLKLNELEPIGNKIVAKLPTKNGYHIITKPFNKNKFNEFYCQWHIIPKPDIHTNNPTILYCK